MMLLDFVLVAIAGMVFVSLVVGPLVIGRKPAGRKGVPRPGLIAKRILANERRRKTDKNPEKQEPPVGDETSRHIYDFFS